jgi:hypothetical protein
MTFYSFNKILKIILCQALRNISGEDRNAHVDASGKFCRIPIRIRRLKRLLNYFVICKDRNQFILELNVE